MRKVSISNFSRVLCALLLCAGCIMFAGCTDDPLGDGENTEQGGNNGGGGSGESASLVSVSLGKVTATTAQFDMTLDLKAMSQYEEAGLIFSSVDDLDISAETATIFQINRESCSKVFTGLMYNTKYYYTTYLKKGTFYLYGDKKEFTTPDVLLELSAGSITATSAQITGTVEGLSESDKSLIEVGMLYSSESGKVEKGEGTKLIVSEIPSDNAVSFDLSELSYGTKYYYCSYVKQGDGYVYGEVKEFVAGSVSVNLSAGSITATTAQITGIVEGLSESDKSLIEVGLHYSSESGQVEKGEGTKLTASEISSDNAFYFDLSDLMFGTKYYYCSYVKQGDGYVYGEVKEFVAGSVSVNLSAGSITATSAQISGIVDGLSESDKSQIEVGMLYSSEAGKVEKGEGTKLTASEISSDNSVSFTLSELAFGTTYHYCSYVKQGGVYLYGDVLDFTSINVTLSELSVVPSSFRAEVSGAVTGLYEDDKEHIKVGVLYSSESGKVENGEGKKIEATEISADGVFSVLFSDLTIETKYYYCSYVKQGNSYTYGTPAEFTTLKHPYDILHDLNVSAATNLSLSGSANCYIVSSVGLYKFKPVKGNSNESVGSVASASLLWETFGTDAAPMPSDLISGFCYKDGYIAFQTADTFKEGNAVIAAKDADGNILWSWHIWFTDQPLGQVYYNNAGVMMDRNLGSTSATPGDVGRPLKNYTKDIILLQDSVFFFCLSDKVFVSLSIDLQ